MENLVSFIWEDGPNANAEFHKLYVFDANGDRIKDFMKTTLSFHKNGQWSYSDVEVFVPEGAYILQIDCNTHRYQTKRLWQAVEGRPELWSQSGKWSENSRWPETPEGMSKQLWRHILTQAVVETVISTWNVNNSIKKI